MGDFKCLPEPIYVWNKNNTKSITTIREQIIWGTSTIRHYADTLQLALSIQGKDKVIDELMKKRIAKTKQEIEKKGDQQW